MSEVAIIGCGPAGLLAAHAVKRSGHTPVIFSKLFEPSPNAHGVFIHRPIPEVTDAIKADLISLIAVGSSHTYAQKVYGRADAPTSWDKYANTGVRGWPIEPVYALLWDRYVAGWGRRDRELEVNYGIASALCHDFPLVINTAPATALCEGGCDFPFRPVWVRYNSPAGLPDNTMMYNGRAQDPWCRASNLFGVGATEYGSYQPGTKQGIKVLPTNCDCLPRVHRAGRWGTWRPGVLLHHAFETAEELCRAL